METPQPQPVPVSEAEKVQNTSETPSTSNEDASKARSGPHGDRPHRADEAENGERDFRRRRQRGDRKAREQMRGFVSMFEGAGLSEERMRGMREVPAARNLLRLSRLIGENSSKITDTINNKSKETLDGFNKKYNETKKAIKVHPSILIALMTLSVAFEAVRQVIFNVIEGLVEAVMKVSSAFSDALHEYYRDKFSPKNDYQEISIAFVLVVASIYSSVINFVSKIGTTLKNGILQLLLQLFGKDLSNCVSRGLTIISVWIQLSILLAFLTPKILISGILLIVILSFFMKMDDLPEEAEAEKKEEKPTESESSTSTPAVSPRLSREEVEKIVNDIVEHKTPLPEELDFHGWMLSDVDKVMPLYFEQRPENDITFIPGRGLHAESGKPTIKPHICEMFKNDDLDFYLHHQGGRVTVNFTKGKKVERTFPEAAEDKINNA